MSVKIGTISSNTGTAISQLTISHVTAQQNNRMLLVAVHVNDAADADPVVTGITYNGLALTKINSAHRGGGGAKSHTELWYLLAPTVGTYNVVITTTGVCDNLGGKAYELYNAMQQAPEAQNTNNLNAVSYISASVTTISGRALVIDAVTANTAVTFTPDAGQTEQYDQSIGGAGRMAGSIEEVIVGSANTQGQTASAATRLAYCVAVITGIHEENVVDVLSVVESSFNVNTLYPFPLYVSALDPFHVLITEHTDVLDLVVEVGVVMEAITVVNQYVILYLDVLNISPYEDVNIVENVSMLRSPNIESSEEEISVTETADISITTLYTSVYEDVLVVDLLDDIFKESEDVFVHDHIDIVDIAYQGVTPIPLFAVDAEYVYINEVAQVIDLIIEVGWAVEYNYIEEHVDIFIDVLTLNVFDDITIVEYRDVRNILIYLSVYDQASVSDVAEVVNPILVLTAAENISIEEQVNVGSTININVQENLTAVDVSIMPFGVEIGDGVGVTGGALTDYIAVLESANVLMPILLVDVSDTIAVAEYATVFDIIIEMSGYDEVAVSEDVQLLDIIIDLPLLTEDITVADVLINIYPGTLSINVVQPMMIVINEHVNILDIMIEVGIVAEYNYVTEWVYSVLDALNISVFDDIGVVEEVEVSVNVLIIDVYDMMAVSEYATVFDIIIEMYAEDNVAITEQVVMSVGSLFIQAYDDIGIQEFVNIFDIIIELGIVYEEITVNESAILEMTVWLLIAAEDISVQDVIVAYPYPLFLSVVENISVVEWAKKLIDILDFDVYEVMSVVEYINMFDIIIELGVVFDDILVVETAIVNYPLTINTFQSVAVQEYKVLSYITSIIVEDILSTIDVLIWLFELEWDLSYPRIYNVIPRRRIFTRDETIYEEAMI